MALIDRVKERIPNQRLKELTNINTRGAPAPDDTVLGFATSDTEAEFEVLSGRAYDETIDSHVSACTRGVLLILMHRSNPTREVIAQLEDWRNYVSDRLRLSESGANPRMLPKSNSGLTIGKDSPNGSEVRPHFDTNEHPAVTDIIPGRSSKGGGTSPGFP